MFEGRGGEPLPSRQRTDSKPASGQWFGECERRHLPSLASRSVCQVIEIITYRRSCKFADHGANLPRADMGATLGDQDFDCRLVCLVCLDGLYRGIHIVPIAEIVICRHNGDIRPDWLAI